MKDLRTISKRSFTIDAKLPDCKEERKERGTIFCFLVFKISRAFPRI